VAFTVDERQAIKAAQGTNAPVENLRAPFCRTPRSSVRWISDLEAILAIEQKIYAHP
jgi:hypothetical protein